MKYNIFLLFTALIVLSSCDKKASVNNDTTDTTRVVTDSSVTTKITPEETE